MGQLNPKKVNNYERCLTAHRRWVKKNAAEFREPIAGDWQASGLTVRVTPELGFRVDGKLYLAKLYLKGPAPTQWCRDATLQLMRNILPPGTEWTPAILDVQRGRLIADQPKSGLNVLLEAEAGVFAALWRGL